MNINYNDTIERNFHGITEGKVNYFNSINAELEYREDNEIYCLYVNSDIVDENKDVNKIIY